MNVWAVNMVPIPPILGGQLCKYFKDISPTFSPNKFPQGICSKIQFEPEEVDGNFATVKTAVLLITVLIVIS